jgi:transcriptional regulator with XRE-family HTH domain
VIHGRAQTTHQPGKNSGSDKATRQPVALNYADVEVTPTLGETIAWYRVTRGMTQEVLAGLVGRTSDWLSKVENGRIPIDRLSVLQALADALRIPLTRLIERSIPTPRTAALSAGLDVSELRTTLTDYSHVSAADYDPEGMDLAKLATKIGEAWSAYQDSSYSRAKRQLPSAITAVRIATRALHGQDRALAYSRLAMAYQGAAMVLTKIGDRDLAWIAADRGLTAAFEADDRLVLGSLYRSVAHCLLANKRLDAAAATIDNATALLAPTARRGPDHLSIYGTLFLVGAMAAARAGDRREVNRYLTHAGKTAELLGHDGNRMWTAFGPTTVHMHHVSAALELGNVETALAQGERLETSALPVERRVRHKLDLAQAHHARGQRDSAEALLLDANELAPEHVSTHYITTKLLTTWVRSPKETPNRHIAALTEKLGVV